MVIGFTKVATTHFKCSNLISAALPLLVFFALGHQALGQTTVTFTGSGTYTVPANIPRVTVEVWGGGGKGSTRTTADPGGGGGGGAYSRSVLEVTAGDKTVTVGAGAATTSPGGDSWFISNTTILAKGGASAADNSRSGAAGGVAASGLGQVRWSGGAGYTHTIANQWGGGGGSSAGSVGNGTNATGQVGAAAPTGGGNGGNGAATNKNGSPGNVPGGGGGGADHSGGTTKIGGSGAGGQVVVSYFLFNTGTAWETGANWAGGTVPANTWRNAIIPDARNVTISSAVTIHSLDILGNSTVTIAPGGNLSLDAS
ncbi:MAG TPA: hypothetical protein VLH56_07355 [Dissulfurispiraceae bacterium]|nr:hypothetical protein [Dissulfurispiraceae bacterium]